ncbi:unnamed protein product [Cladocopium goreaui]|uniref:Probable prolyl 4-hydroxylase 6 (AtP4H6) n=1 Tax=Cladocopium goreaui TaxID=2562237 RepID=A0A9P1DBJ6_9DINO|nr:unnamed protein product [Cladocopium goreaui]
MNCPRFDETLRNASCRAVSGSIPRRTIRAGDGRDLANDGSCQSQLNVEVFRDTPPIVLVKGFATVEDCEKLLNQVDGLPSAPAKASGAAEGFIRRSSSKNLDWEMLHPTDDLRVFKSRMFALTRNLTGYPIPSEASEALNIAAYGIGDEYRAHCDGRCGGSALDRHGERVATSIVYCEVAALGGHTTFTSQHLKVVPQQGDMLVFGYLEDGRLSREVEHSACPVVAGRKWIATQWYRSHGEKLQPQRVLAKPSDEEVWKYPRTLAYDADAWEARFGSRQVSTESGGPAARTNDTALMPNELSSVSHESTCKN